MRTLGAVTPVWWRKEGEGKGEAPGDGTGDERVNERQLGSCVSRPGACLAEGEAGAPLVVLASLQTRCPPSTEGTFVRWLQTVVQCALGAGALPSYCAQCWGTIRGAWAKQQDIGHHQRT